jgi:hypothetical protein
MFDERWQYLESVGPHDKLVMIGADVLGDPSRMM